MFCIARVWPNISHMWCSGYLSGLKYLHNGQGHVGTVPVCEMCMGWVWVNIWYEHTNIDSHFSVFQIKQQSGLEVIDRPSSKNPTNGGLVEVYWLQNVLISPSFAYCWRAAYTVGAGGREARALSQEIHTDLQRKKRNGREGGPCLETVGLLIDFLTLSSVAALSIFTSGRRRPPGPGPMSDTTPLQSTVLFLFPWKPL